MSAIPETETPDRIGAPAPLTPRVVAVEPIAEARLRVRFADGTEREVDVAPVLHLPVFQPLADPEAFRAVAIVDGGGGVEWASGADLCADTLYADGPRAPAP